ncbi:DUF3253 domain-containing protein [Paeniglutamicibacter sp. ZC-3]|uniref:DUF3253 domain-containing protein n=1 Tax=Paeniglutamicibacter TaxID=1742990 RepID=UPI0021F73970|nr:MULTISPECIES: DUF3253 domain-containing protein [Paeniglutamicibacter]MCV9996048.1 DUF3253 domain-containing protein [Paeniglutamicibacter sp. ZC-3]MDO2934484.1 DUF3253 domain-containing protein [Paeniglutamicibacter sulfureus]
MTHDKTPDTTPDGHHLIINGRKWRASDPSIPPKLRQELVEELMAARRAVKAHENEARARVNDAKIALGERGQPWWEAPEPQAFNERISATIRALLRKRIDSSICPSEVARIVSGKGDAWRDHMSKVRRVASEMACRGEIVATQKGIPVEADNVRGPIRLKRGTSVGDIPSGTRSE